MGSPDETYISCGAESFKACPAQMKAKPCPPISGVYFREVKDVFKGNISLILDLRKSLRAKYIGDISCVPAEIMWRKFSSRAINVDTSLARWGAECGTLPLKDWLYHRPEPIKIVILPVWNAWCCSACEYNITSSDVVEWLDANRQADTRPDIRSCQRGTCCLCKEVDALMSDGDETVCLDCANSDIMYKPTLIASGWMNYEISSGHFHGVNNASLLSRVETADRMLEGLSIPAAEKERARDAIILRLGDRLVDRKGIRSPDFRDMADAVEKAYGDKKDQ